MAIYMAARWQCNAGAEATVRAALEEFVAAIRDNEPGTQLYTALQGTEDPTQFMTYFIFEDEAARQFHRSTDWVTRFTEIIYPENVEPVEFTEYRLVASTDA